MASPVQEHNSDGDRGNTGRISFQTGEDEATSHSGEDDGSVHLSGSGGTGATREALAEGILSLLTPAIHALDKGVANTRRSQDNLAQQIGVLSEQLHEISKEQACPVDLESYVTRLTLIKGKISIIDSLLHSAQERLNRVHEQTVKESNRRKPLIEAPHVSTSKSSPTSVSEEGKEEDSQSIPGDSQ